jgi:hypothetical protein
MSIVRCPRCRDEVTVPARASQKALVRCPLCLEEYVLQEALSLMPPALEVIDGSLGVEEPALVAAGAAAGEESYELSGPRERSAGFAGAFDASPGTGSVAAAPRPSFKGARPKRKERGVVGMVLGPVLGGIVGIVLAQLVLWWLFGKDPVQLGPKVADYVPQIVPARFHPKEARDRETGGSSGTTAPGSSRNASRTSGPSTAGNDPSAAGSSQPGTNFPLGNSGLTGQQPPETPTTDDLSLPGPDAAGGIFGDPPLAAPELDPLPTIDPPLIPEVTATLPNTEALGTDPGAAKPTTEEPTLPPEPTSGEPAASESTAGERPIPTTADFQRGVSAAVASLEKLEAPADPSLPAEEVNETRRQLYTDLYNAAAEVGRLATYVSTSDADLIDAVGSLNDLLGKLVTTKSAALNSLTGIKLPELKADEGALVMGTVREFRAAGSMFELTVEAGRMRTPVAIVSPTNPQDFCAPGDPIVVVGRIVEEPKKNISGFEGDHERVVLYGASAVGANPE